ncbi:unnamed protein product [Rotaria sp. Silwood2]|nr:unnamed protein product [Rotaria sp. Silwood2]CAF3082608.1 unnamed protein product [Rotaria sp. Silwood2]CAF3319861.1 unnamed protein product [Rotaria sp. Silwood2]CAF4240361.1 unnamed protein product [Rotaria sp. Silwood2]CAF4287523.1 unnamed protein product [Rotaria sp. Silwood2]
MYANKINDESGELDSQLVQANPILADERTFHIFYQLLRDYNTKMITDYLLEDFNRYRYLTHRNITITDIDDDEEFQNTVNVMQIMNMSNDDLNSIF